MVNSREFMFIFSTNLQAHEAIFFGEMVPKKMSDGTTRKVFVK